LYYSCKYGFNLEIVFLLVDVKITWIVVTIIWYAGHALEKQINFWKKKDKEKHGIVDKVWTPLSKEQRI
jgi:hypothetical protein